MAITRGAANKKPLTSTYTVGAVEALSSLTFRTKRLFELSAKWGDDTQPPPPNTPRDYRTMQHLRPSQVDDLVATYKAGSTTKQLAAMFGVHRNTVAKHLQARGIDTTPTGLTPDQLAEATRLYESGEPLSRIAAILPAPQSTIRDHLHAAGVTMRKAVKPRKNGT